MLNCVFDYFRLFNCLITIPFSILFCLFHMVFEDSIKISQKDMLIYSNYERLALLTESLNVTYNIQVGYHKIL